jgi:carbon-monoxide dehydrogenase medium subunit
MRSMALAIHRSSKMIPDFTLHRPDTVAEALTLSQHFGEAAAFMAGGVSLINILKTGIPLGNVIHLGRLPAFTTIALEPGRLRIGAGVTLWQLQTAPEIAALGTAVHQSITEIGNVRVRMKGTIGGNIMARDPNYDVTPVMIALGAVLRFANEDGSITETPATQRGWPQTMPQGLLLSVAIPIERTWFGYDRTLRPALTLSVGIDSSQGQARIGIACAYPQAFSDTITLPARDTLPATAAAFAQDWAATLPEPITDATASGRYRRRLAAILLRRQLELYAATPT